MSRSPLDKAASLALRGRYGELISLLEPQLPIYRESQRFYYLLGSACLRTGDLGGAFTYLKRAEQLGPEDRDTLLCLAALHLRRGEGQKAAELYLQVLEAHPGDALAQRALAFMRKSDAETLVASLVAKGDFARFYPRPKGLRPFVVPSLAIAALALVALLLAPVAREALGALRDARSPRPEIAAVDLSENELASPVETGGSYAYILTEKEAVAGFERVKRLFEAYRDNAALVEINRLVNSNASEGIKEKARTLKSFVSPPDFRTVKDVPSYEAVAKEPGLYEGCSVVWRGSAANIDAAKGRTSFHFLVGYVDGKRLEGIVPVEMPESVGLVPSSSPFELLAILRVSGGGPRLEGVAIHNLKGD